jgi:hypothetical protein
MAQNLRRHLPRHPPAARIAARRLSTISRPCSPSCSIASACCRYTRPMSLARLAKEAGDKPSSRRKLDALAGTVALVDRGWQETGSVTARRTASVFAGYRFPPDVISFAVRWYLRYGLSYRDAGERWPSAA